MSLPVNSNSLWHAGADETKLTREALKWPYGEFEIPGEVYDAFGAAGKKGQALEEEWTKVHLPLVHSSLLQPQTYIAFHLIPALAHCGLATMLGCTVFKVAFVFVMPGITSTSRTSEIILQSDNLYACLDGISVKPRIADASFMLEVNQC